MIKKYKTILAFMLTALLALQPLYTLQAQAMTAGQLPPGEVILSQANIDEGILNPEAPAYGSIGKSAVQGEPFTEALRLTTAAEPSADYLLQLEMPIHAAIEKDDVILASFYARTISSTHETAEGKVTLVMEREGTWEKSIKETMSIPPQWKQFFVPIKAALLMEADQSQVTLRFGYKPQVIEIAGLQAVNYKKAVTIDDLPSTPVYYEGMEPDAPWRAEADQRIEQYRKGDLEVVVLDKDGKPVQGADVHVAMTKHDFHFGTAVNSSMIFGTGADAEMYRNKLKENFNAVVMENEQKWPWWEGDKARAARLYNWLGENGFDVRGHTLIWDGQTRVPSDIPGMVGDKEALNKRIRDHMDEVAGYFKGRLYDWDVINEPTANKMIRGVYGDTIAADWLKYAKEADPNAKLYINETQILGLDAPVIGQFSNFLQVMKDQGAPLDGIGIQAHFGSTPVSPMKFYDQLTHFTQYANEIAITEFDMNSPREDIQAQFTRDILIAAFSHPNVESFMMWGFWDGAHWQNNAPLFRADWTLKPSGEEWRRLIYDEWWTDVQGATDANGSYKTRGFYGEYDVTMSYGGEVQTLHASLAKGGANKVTITLGEQSNNELKPFVPLPIPNAGADITAPVWPYGSSFMASEASPTSVSLAWPEAYDNNGVDHYLIYQNGSLAKQVPSDVTAYDVTNLTKGQAYTFTIVAVDADGNQSAASQPIRANTAAGDDDTKPGWKKGSYLTVTELRQHEAMVSWPRAVDNVEVAGYRLYVNGKYAGDTNQLSYKLTGLAAYAPYTVRVEVKDQSGNISVGGPLAAFRTLGASDTASPTWNAPALTASELSSDGLTLAWTSAQDNRGVTAYRLFEGNEEIVTLPADTARFRVEGLKPNTPYTFRVEAGDAGNNWSDTGPSVAATTLAGSDAEAPTWPDARSLQYAVLTDRGVTLNWTAAQDNIGVSEYRIYQDGTLLGTAAADVSSYAVANLAADRSYAFRIEAVDASGNVSSGGPNLAVRTSQGLVRETHKLYPSDDAFTQAPAVFGGAGTTNNLNYLRYKNAAGVSGSEQNKNTGNNRRVYMKFPLSAVTGNIYEASLNMYVSAVQTANMDIAMDVYATGDQWTETSINWANKPVQGTKLGSSAIRNQGFWKSVPVTDYVVSEANGDQYVSFLVQDDAWSDQNVDFPSKEAANAAQWPYLSVSTEAPATDTDAPAWTGGSLAASDTQPDSVRLSWSGASDQRGINGYRIYRDGALAGTVGADRTAFTATGLTPSSPYEFRVEAFDAVQESTGGPSVQVTTPGADVMVPAWPQGAEVIVTEESRHGASLQWTAAEDNYSVAQYRIYAGSELLATIAGNAAAYTIQGLPAGTVTALKLIALDKAGNESAALDFHVATAAPDAESPTWAGVRTLAVSQLSDTGALLEWPAAVDNTGITAYRIYRGDSLAAELRGTASRNYIQGLEAKTAYTFTAVAVDAAGNTSAPLASAPVRTLAQDSIAPAWPTGSRVTASLDTGGAELQWDEAVDNEGVSRYDIYSGSGWIASVNGDKLSYTVSGASDSTAVYRIEAVDATGNRTPSSLRTNDPDIPVPVDTTPPSWSGNSSLTASGITSTSMALTWTGASDPLGIGLYNVYMNGELIGSPSVANWFVDGLQPDTEYAFKVEAADTLNNWSSGGPTLAVKTLAASTTPVTPPTGGAGWPITQPGNGQATIHVSGSQPVDGKVAVSVDRRTITQAFAQTSEDVDGNRTIAIALPASAAAAVKGYTFELPADVLGRSGKDKRITLVTPIGSFVLPGNMLANNVAAMQRDSVTISIAEAGLPKQANVKGTAGPVLELQVISGGEALAYSNPDAAVQVRISYQLAGKQDVESVSVWRIDENGRAVLVPSGFYDAATGQVTFETSQSGRFAVAEYAPAFEDLGSVAWAKQAIQALAAKGIVNGVSPSAFQPKANVSRADFTKLVIEALGLAGAAGEARGSAFQDVSERAYYYDAVSAAYALGIVNGGGDGQFRPAAPITRQEMLVIAANALKHTGRSLPAASGLELSLYGDRGEVSPYASSSVAAMVKAGLAQGSDNRIEPKRTTTRAEAAVLVYRLFNYVYR
ncbi:fibronectin type III domain-containing protein [Paenibacillus sp. MMS18-CY102]|uniref:fibronectin type III domain-containing protein n=1 Tax=Paenibacillus sp. MMS18-CY102 TaxID=2682849 RepID=UPI001365CC73|nr:endo-1,4-beta-xylanase [Paenibacillus sp. MMS18-CY102]